jgi:hypothetical protein
MVIQIYTPLKTKKTGMIPSQNPMVSAMRTITIGLSALPQIPGLGCHRWTQLRVIHLF